MNRFRYGMRLLWFFLTLLCCDVMGSHWLGPLIKTDFGGAYRLPNNQEVSFLPHYRNYIQQTQAPAQTDWIFLGSSPTYGVNIKDPKNTYPYAFEAALKQAKPDAQDRVYNLGAKGFLMGDLAYTLKAVLDSGDRFVIQLNYHTFSPKLLKATPIRHPDLATTLGVPITHAEARMIGARPTPFYDLNTPLSVWLKKHWFFYRERDRLALYWLHDTPESWFYHRFFEKDKTEDTPNFKPFYELKPARQLYIVKRYSENAEFILTPENSELQFLQGMLKQLKAADKQALFYIAPINVDGLSFYAVMDWAQYRENMALVEKTVRQAGFAFWDTNLTEPLPEDYFADISHTLDNGGQMVGQQLFQAVQKAGML